MNGSNRNRQGNCEMKYNLFVFRRRHIKLQNTSIVIASLSQTSPSKFCAGMGNLDTGLIGFYLNINVCRMSKSLCEAGNFLERLLQVRFDVVDMLDPNA